MKQIFAFLICVVILHSGCAMQPTTTTTPATPASVTEESQKLPSSYGPLSKNHRSIQEIGEVFQKVESLRKADRLTVSDLQAITRATRFSPIMVSGCDLEVLKIFVASNWAPVVITRSPVGPKHVKVVVKYDDSSEQLTVVEPLGYAPAVFRYSEFTQQWDDPQKSCLLVFSEYVGTQRVENVLRKYLSKEKIDSLRIEAQKKL